MNQLIKLPFDKDHTLIWESTQWPYFQWNSSSILDSLVKVKHQQGKILSLAYLEQLFEGESITFDSPITPLILNDIHLNTLSKLSIERLFGWHHVLFANSYSGTQKITTADYRKNNKILNSKQVVPSFKNLPHEVTQFLNWWNESPVGLDGLIRAGIAYFWFITISPFEDGNTQIATAFLEYALCQDEKINPRPYSLKNLITEENKDSFLHVLLNCQHSTGDITSWLNWLFESLYDVMRSAELTLLKNQKKRLFQNKFLSYSLNERQIKILSFLCDKYLEYPDQNFYISNKDCVNLCLTNREAIKRDMAELYILELIKKGDQMGRSTKYTLNTDFFKV